jgi:hypothetical protein
MARRQHLGLWFGPTRAHAGQTDRETQITALVCHSPGQRAAILLVGRLAQSRPPHQVRGARFAFD